MMPWLFAVLFAASRVPGLMPPNFSAVYGFVLCAGAFLPGRIGWIVPLVTMLVTDVGLNFYYQFGKGWDVWSGASMISHFGNYIGYAVLWGTGRWLRPRAKLWNLVGGSIVGAALFYLVTNTLAWLFNPFQNPEYTKTLAGWIIALTSGTGNWDATWTFFIRSLTSSALFTALFASTWIYSGAESPADKGEEPVRAPAPAEAEAEEAKA
ncbi:MAG TPA: DUF6580 family putative transport protein [Candidatus Limnocylindria bacterium]|jgi:hypothetical protein|nr:DUF6580 family putative transport protein [Candidatus Limnocylindria bacterium]